MSDKLKYSCNNCGHVWEGDEFTLDCENCNSADIEIAKDKGGKTTPSDPDSTITGKKSEPKPNDRATEDGTVVIKPDEAKQNTNTKSGDATISSSSSGQAATPGAIPQGSSSQGAGASNSGAGSTTPPPPPPPPASGPEKKKGKGGLIALILVLILGGAGVAYFVLNGDDPKGDDPKDEEPARAETVEGGAEVNLKVEERNQIFYLSGTIIEDNEEKDLDLEQVVRLYRASDNETFKFNAQTGQIYICPEQEGTAKLEVQLKDTEIGEQNSDALELSLFGNAPATEAGCVHRLSEDAIEVAFDANCNLQITINDKHPFKSITTSISGKEGPFKKQFKYNMAAQANETLDVWVKQDDLAPIAYEQNGTQKVPVCLTASDDNTNTGGGAPDPEAQKQKIEQLIKDVAEAATQFGLDPQNRAAGQKLRTLTMSLVKQPVFVIDGTTYTGYSNGSNQIKISNRNDGTRYMLSSPPQIVDNQYFKLEYRSK